MAARRAKAAQASRSGAEARILAAADELIAERGSEAVSAQDVAARARVPKGLVFYYFGSMDALVGRVLEGYYAAHLSALAGALEGGGPLRERLHRLVDGYLDFIEKNRRYARLIQREVAGEGRHRALIGRNLGALYGWMEEALRGVAPAHGPLAARQLFVTFSAAVINYFTYAPVIGAAWGSDPMDAAGLAERRAHVHWLVDAVLERLPRGPAEEPAAARRKGPRT